MRFAVEQAPNGAWRVVLEGADAPISVHDTEDEARERLGSYVRGAMAAAAPTVETGVARGERVTLRNGREVILRAVQPEDRALLLDAFEGRFGDESRYRRFMTPKQQLTPSELSGFTDIDHDVHEAFGAIDPATGNGIGIARFIRDAAGSPRAEAAIALADEWQGCGLGQALLRRLADRALELGVTCFHASQFSDNRAMLTLFGRLGPMDVAHDGSTLLIDVALDG